MPCNVVGGWQKLVLERTFTACYTAPNPAVTAAGDPCCQHPATRKTMLVVFAARLIPVRIMRKPLTTSSIMPQVEYSFTIFLSDVSVMTDDMAEALVAAGCDDGSPFSRQGQAGIDMDRIAASLQDAIRSAVANVHTAGFQVDRVELSQEALQTL